MDIVSCTDNNYVMPLGVAITSLFENNEDEKITVHVITNNVSESGIENLKQIANNYSQQILFYTISSELLEHLPVRKSGYLTNSAYIRIFITEILPQHLDKVMYLDCDLIVNKSLRDFWETDISNYSVGVVLDTFANDLSYYERLQYDKSYGYFNSGVMLINLKYWRDKEVYNKCILYIKNHFDEIVNEDQDVLNAVLYESTYYFPLKFNAVCTLFFKDCPFDKSLEEQIEEAIEQPVIIHYTYIKPWHIEDRHPLSSTFFTYQRKTIWKNQHKALFFKNSNIYKARVKRMLFKMNILKRDSPYIELKNN